METELLTFFLGTAIAAIAVLLTALGIALRNGRQHTESNPNMTTLDEKLNEILIVLNRIDAKLGVASN